MLDLCSFCNKDKTNPVYFRLDFYSIPIKIKSIEEHWYSGIRIICQDCVNEITRINTKKEQEQ